MPESFPKGYYLSSVKVGPKGQIVIPKEAREMFQIQPGDTLLLLADEKQGIALHKYEVFRKIMEQAGVPKPAFDADPGKIEEGKEE